MTKHNTINVVIGMPSGTGKSTHASQIPGVVDIDDVFKEDETPLKTKEQLKALRRQALESGNWDAYQKIYVPYVGHALEEYHMKHGPIDVLLIHGRSSLDKLGYDFEYHTVMRDPIQHMVDLARRIGKGDDDPKTQYTSMMVGATNALSNLNADDKPTMVKTHDDVRKFILSKMKMG